MLCALFLQALKILSMVSLVYWQKNVHGGMVQVKIPDQFDLTISI